MSEAPPGFEDFVYRGETQFVDLFCNREHHILVAVRRQGAPMPAEDVDRAHREMFDFAPGKVHTWRLIVDTRAVTGNNDKRFESAISTVDVLLLSHFERVIVLVRSVIGKLHATRLSPMSERFSVTTDPEAALSALLAPDAPTHDP